VTLSFAKVNAQGIEWSVEAQPRTPVPFPVLHLSCSSVVLISDVFIVYNDIFIVKRTCSVGECPIETGCLTIWNMNSDNTGRSNLNAEDSKDDISGGYLTRRFNVRQGTVLFRVSMGATCFWEIWISCSSSFGNGNLFFKSREHLIPAYKYFRNRVYLEKAGIRSRNQVVIAFERHKNKTAWRGRLKKDTIPL
jgi:hypothetical protein